MSTTRMQHPLPAPVVHAGFSVSQSKSHVLAGVQDAYWSDEEEDVECPLCLEEMDISDLNFKPCVCGYQICRFCWHHIKENLNKRCPACRRIYTDEAVEFKPVATQDHKRLTQQKKQRDRERKELDALGRRHLANVRVVQRNIVYVVGIGSQFAKEELIPTLRSNEYFGQYGKITKIVLVKRTPPGGGAPVVGLYITYYRREDAARAIAAVDGTPSPGGGREIMRASHGTTKYCMAFLRGVACGDHNCMNLHTWGDEKDCFTKEDLTTLKHTMKVTESRSRSKKEDPEGLPRTAAWGHKSMPSASTNNSTSSNRTGRRGATNARQQQRTTTGNESRRKGTSGKSASQTSSRPSTPSGLAGLPPRPPSPVDATKLSKPKKEPPIKSESPAPSVATESEKDIQDASPTSPVIDSLNVEPAPPSAPSAPPGLPAIPPGLAAPPGIPPRPPRPDTASPQTPLLSSQTSYQMSTIARSLLDDMRARREMPHVAHHSPFPDLDRTLQNLTGGDGGFRFDLDPKFAGEEVDDNAESFPDFDLEARTPFNGTYMDAFPGLRTSAPSAFAPPGLVYPHNPSRSIYDPLAVRPKIDTQSTGGSSYIGSFNPFADGNDESNTAASSPRLPSDDDTTRRVSRFGFARGRQGSATSSPLHASSPLSIATSNNESTHLFYNSTDVSHSPAPSQWSMQSYNHSSSALASPLVSNAPQPPQFTHSRFQPFDSGVSEAQLRDFIQSSRERASLRSNTDSHIKAAPNQQYSDPAIMSARLASTSEYAAAMHAPPPGLYPSAMPNVMGPPAHVSPTESSSSLPLLSSTDFPALPTSSVELSSRKDDSGTESIILSLDAKAQEKADRKAAKKAAAAEKAAERQKIAEERAAQKAADRAKLAQEKAAEKERTAVLKAQQEKERLEKEKVAKEKEKERERVAKAEKERQAQLEKEKLDRDKNEKEKAAKRAAVKQADTQKPSKPAKPTPGIVPVPEPPTQAPLLSRKPKKNKPVAKPIRIVKEDDHVPADEVTATASAATTSEIPPAVITNESSSTNSRAQSVERNGPVTVAKLLQQIQISSPSLNLAAHSFFDLQKVNPAAKMPLEYGPLVHALSALSVGGGTFANNVPSGSIDNAVSSFQQLLETLTQTISDLLRLLPRTTWDDSSSFDGVLRDMLKGDDFLDDGGEENNGKEDEVAALTMALERRARWMEVQLSKLEELHRDINTAAVKAVLTFNDNGWDRRGFLPRAGNTLQRFEGLGVIQEDGKTRAMTIAELEEKATVAKEAAVLRETEVRESMERLQAFRPGDERL